MVENTCYVNVDQLTGRIREQEVSPVEVVRASLERIEKLNPLLNAFITVLPDEALEQARAAAAEIEAGHWRGPLHGIPVGVRICTTRPASRPRRRSSASRTACRQEMPSR